MKGAQWIVLIENHNHTSHAWIVWQKSTLKSFLFSAKHSNISTMLMLKTDIVAQQTAIFHLILMDMLEVSDLGTLSQNRLICLTYHSVISI